MPNWCDNQLTITGPENEIRRFREEARTGDQPLSLHKFIPLPEELENEDQSGGLQWLQYTVLAIGTKWDIDHADVKKENNRIDYFFSSAWSPPVPWMIRVSEAFPKLEFKLWYEEPGMWFRGEVTARNGEILSDIDLTEEMSKDYKDEEGESA